MLTEPDFKQKQIIFVMLSYGEKLSFKNDNIIVKDTDGKIKHQSTCYRLFALFVVGHISITSGLLQRAEKFGFTIVLMTHNLRVYGTWCCPTKGNVLLRKKQYQYNGVDIAKYVVTGKINSQLGALKSIRRKSPQLKKAIDLLKQYQQNLLQDNNDLQKLLGIEGSAARAYFNGMFHGYNWTARRPRVKHDITNCLMDIGYTLLFNIIEALLNIYGFDLYQGVYHRQFYQRKSLVCDIVEPFRPLVDARIRKAYNLNQINKCDFSIRQKQYNLFGKKANPYVLWLLEAILARKVDMFRFVQSYYRSFMRNKPIDQYPVFEL